MRSALACVVAVATLAAGCGREPDNFGGPIDITKFDQRAAEVAAAWQAGGVDDAWTNGFVPVQDLVIAPPDGFPNSEMKNAFGAGWYKTFPGLQLPDQGGNGTITFPDGAKMDVALVSAAEAFQAMDQGDPSCPDCVSLVVTKAEPGTAKLRTSRGEAQVPVWNYTVEGMTEPVARVAVSPESIKPLPTPSIPDWARDAPLVSAQELDSMTDTLLEYRLGVGACDKAITGMVWENDQVVVIGGMVIPPGPAEACTAQLVEHPVQVYTKTPVGDRVILDAITGAPVLLR